MGHDATQKKPPGRVRTAVLFWCVVVGIAAVLVLVPEIILEGTPWYRAVGLMVIPAAVATLGAILFLTGVVKPGTVIFRHRRLPGAGHPAWWFLAAATWVPAAILALVLLRVILPAVVVVWLLALGALNLRWQIRRRKWERAGLPALRNKKLEWAARLAVALAIFGPYAGYRIYLRAAVNAELAAIRRDGYPATLEELDAWYPEPPRGQNAADVYMRAFAAYVEPPREVEGRLPFSSREEPLARGAEMRAEMRDAVEQHLAANGTTLGLLHEAVAFRQCRYPVRLADGPFSSDDHLNGVRHCCRLLTDEAILCADGRQGDEACAALLDGLALARSLESEPQTMAFLMRRAMLGLTTWGLEHVLSRTPLPEARLAELAAAFEEAENADGLVRALVGERCEISRICRNFFGIAEHGKRKTISGRLLSAGFGLWLDRPYLGALRRMNEWVRLCRDVPLPNRLEAVANLEAEPDRAVAAHPLGALLLDFLPEVSSTLPVRHAEGIATLRATRCGLAIERYRLATGTLPEGLNQLVPDSLEAVPDDPFTGQPILYKRLSAGYVVYSVGPDRADDGGTERERAEGPGDITFTVSR